MPMSAAGASQPAFKPLTEHKDLPFSLPDWRPSMPVAEITPFVSDALPAPLGADRATSAVRDRPSPPTASTSTGPTVDESRTAAEAGAALSAFLVQMSSGAATPFPSAAPGTDNLPTGGGSSVSASAEALLVALKDPTPPPGNQTISLVAGSRDTAALSNTAVLPSPASDPVIGAATARMTSEIDLRASLSPEAGNVFIVDDSSTSADAGAALAAFLIQTAPSEAGAMPNANSRAVIEAGPTIASPPQMRGASETSSAPERDVDGEVEGGGDVGFAEAARASLQAALESASGSRPVGTTSNDRDAPNARDDRSAAGKSVVATLEASGVMHPAVRPLDHSSASSVPRIAETTSLTDGDSTRADPGPALSVPLSSDPLPGSAFGNDVEQDTSGDLSRAASEPPTPAPPLANSAVLDLPGRDAGDAAVVGSDLVAAGLLPFVMTLAPMRTTEDNHRVPTDRVAATAPALASGSATSTNGGSGRSLLKHARSAYPVLASDTDNDVPIDASQNGLL